jgi:hypothetical protein
MPIGWRVAIEAGNGAHNLGAFAMAECTETDKMVFWDRPARERRPEIDAIVRRMRRVDRADSANTALRDVLILLGEDDVLILMK